MFKRIHHVAVICSDYARSKRFYTEILGLQILAENHRAERDSYKLDLQISPGHQIELFSFADPPSRPDRPEARGLRHLAFEVDDLDASIADLQQHGIAVEPSRTDPYTGQRYTFFKDPDGLPLELVES